MKKILILLAALFIIADSYASVNTIEPKLNASEILFPVGKTGKTISLMELSQIKLKDFEALTGEKMNFFKRLTFKVTQKQLRNSINNDGTFSKKKLEKYFSKPVDGQKGFNLGGFLLGFFLGWWGVGILIAYLIKDDKRKNRIKWMWIGLAAAAVFFLILLVAGAFNFNFSI